MKFVLVLVILYCNYYCNKVLANDSESWLNHRHRSARSSVFIDSAAKCERETCPENSLMQYYDCDNRGFCAAHWSTGFTILIIFVFLIIFTIVALVICCCVCGFSCCCCGYDSKGDVQVINVNGVGGAPAAAAGTPATSSPSNCAVCCVICYSCFRPNAATANNHPMQMLNMGQRAAVPPPTAAAPAATTIGGPTVVMNTNNVMSNAMAQNNQPMMMPMMNPMFSQPCSPPMNTFQQQSAYQQQPTYQQQPYSTMATNQTPQHANHQPQPAAVPPPAYAESCQPQKT